MVSVISLWMPILLSAVMVFVVSSIIHMLLGYHKTDFGKLTDEDGVMDALRGFNIPKGEYIVPCAGSMKECGNPEFVEKTKKGPVLFMTVLDNGPMTMGKSLMHWFLYSVIVSIFAAYISGRALGAGAHYMSVFRFAGCTAFVGYSLALMQNSIWYKRSWVVTLKSMFDGLVYALATAGIFGWLWPA